MAKWKMKRRRLEDPAVAAIALSLGIRFQCFFDAILMQK